MNRRNFMITTAFAAAIPFLSGAETQPETKKEKRFKFGAYEGSLGNNSLAIASQIGLDGLQPVMSDRIKNPKVRKAYLDEAQKAVLEFGSLALGVLNNIPLKSDPKAIEILKDSIAVAQALGAKIVMIAQFSKGNLKGDKAGIDKTVAILKEHAPSFEKAGLILSIETTNLSSRQQKISNGMPWWHTW